MPSGNPVSARLEDDIYCLFIQTHWSSHFCSLFVYLIVFLSVFISICMHVYMYIYMSPSSCVYLAVWLYLLWYVGFVCTYVRLCVSTCVCAYVYTCTCVRACSHARARVCKRMRDSSIPVCGLWASNAWLQRTAWIQHEIARLLELNKSLVWILLQSPQ